MLIHSTFHRAGGKQKKLSVGDRERTRTKFVGKY